MILVIQLKNLIRDTNTITNQFTISSDEPTSLTVTQTQSGHIVVHVYRGENPGEFDEPIGAFDSNTGNITWSDNLTP